VLRGQQPLPSREHQPHRHRVVKAKNRGVPVADCTEHHTQTQAPSSAAATADDAGSFLIWLCEWWLRLTSKLVIGVRGTVRARVVCSWHVCILRCVKARTSSPTAIIITITRSSSSSSSRSTSRVVVR
jgi:hypothetical protein